MRDGERQVASTLKAIRHDHVARYEWAGARIKRGMQVLDMGCGVGYGSNILAQCGAKVVAYDIDAEAIDYARKHWSHPRARFEVRDLSAGGEFPKADVAVCFEMIEHTADPLPMLKALREAGVGRLFASVPNEAVFPHEGRVAFHHRHYTAGQFQDLLAQAGWAISAWHGQDGPESDVTSGCGGRTILADCSPAEPAAARLPELSTAPRKPAPKHVAILGLGPSLDEYTNLCKRLGGRHRYCDETWVINALGAVIQCDRIFHMDDVRIQEARAIARPESNIAAMLEWMRHTDIPITTSRPHPDYPTTEPFPLIEVLNAFQYGYFNSTAAYAVAYAMWLGVEKISMFGCDFTYPNAHDAEKGRACVEFWLGMAVDRNIRVVVPKTSTLLDALHTQRERFYGYDTLDLHITQDPDGIIQVQFSERAEADIPTADQVEAAYDHDAHPNALMAEVT